MCMHHQPIQIHQSIAGFNFNAFFFSEIITVSVKFPGIYIVQFDVVNYNKMFESDFETF